MTGELRLVRLDRAREAAFREMRADYAAAGEDHHAEVAAAFRRYVALFDAAAEGVAPPGYVPWTTFWLERDDGRLLGGIRLRHHLNEALWQDGGHIGYDVRPSERNQGYGTRMLALALDEARVRGFTWVLLTVDPVNVASVRVIARNGGRKIGRATRSGYDQYRIDLGPAPPTTAPARAQPAPPNRPS